MSAPLVPGYITGRETKTWRTWEYLWDALGDGEWHRCADLARGWVESGLEGLEAAGISQTLRRASGMGLIQREERSIEREPAFGSFNYRYAKRGTESWYRRTPEDGAL